LIKLFNFISTTEVNIDSVTEEREAALVAKELLIAAKAKECRLSESGNKIISKDKV
jgi:hypothetical protein